MSAVKFIHRTDVHQSDHAPTSRVDDWPNTVNDKLLQIAELARIHKCDVVTDNGDFWNDKTPFRVSHSLVSKVCQVHEVYPCPVFGNVGNHDVRHSKIEFLDESPLGTLFEAGIFQRCYDDHAQVIRKPGIQVRFRGIPYHGSKYDLERFKLRKEPGDDHLVVMAHVLASPNLRTMFDNEDVIAYSQLPELGPEVSVWAFGHWHVDQGITRLPNGALVINLGSLTRGALVQDNLDRIPRVGLVTLEKGKRPEAEALPLKVKPASEVFDLQRRSIEEVREVMVHIFSTSLAKEIESAKTGASLEDVVSAVESFPKVRTKALEILEKARHAK